MVHGNPHRGKPLCVTVAGDELNQFVSGPAWSIAAKSASNAETDREVVQGRRTDELDGRLPSSSRHRTRRGHCRRGANGDALEASARQDYPARPLRNRRPERSIAVVPPIRGFLSFIIDYR
jgi:hypothetical protein